MLYPKNLPFRRTTAHADSFNILFAIRYQLTISRSQCFIYWPDYVDTGLP